MQIRHFEHKNIDFKRWDNAITNSQNMFTYAYSWYLNVVSPEWEALIGGDYEYLMPLPVKRKYHIPYIVQPFLTQQLGVFSRHEVTQEILENFIKKIPYYSYELHLNENNEYPDITLLPNFVLNLNKPYEHLAKDFAKNTLRNIKKASELPQKVSENTDIALFLEFYTSTATHLKKSQIHLINKVLRIAVEKNEAQLFSVQNTDNQIIASLALLTCPNRMIYFLPASSSEGKKSYSMFLLVDFIIKKHAGEKKIFDFEGSAIEGIARFYKGFGAVNQPYYSLKRFRPSFLVGKFSEKS
jgi:hypothetical protein